MNKKTLIVSLVAVALLLNVTALEVWAFGGGKGKEGYKGFEKKFFCKAHMILKNRDDLEQAMPFIMGAYQSRETVMK